MAERTVVGQGSQGRGTGLPRQGHRAARTARAGAEGLEELVLWDTVPSHTAQTEPQIWSVGLSPNQDGLMSTEVHCTVRMLT